MSRPDLPPVSPRVATLPFADLSWGRFEQFAHDLLLALPGMRPGTAHRYGTQGQAQRGIDLTVQREDGERWGLSNKRYKKYQPHHVAKHVADTTYPADRYFIVVSRVASTDVRDEVRKHPKWDLWDAEDLSQKVRLELQLEIARRLVDHHFGPVWRRDFLGLPAVGAFLPPADYFRPYLVGERLFHHAFPLVGRQALLDDLVAFADSARERVLVLPGRGGIGKSRLLREWAERLDAAHPDRAVRLLNEGVPLSLEALDDLPAVPCLIGVDDAHRRTDLGLLLAWLRQRPEGKLFLATRLPGVDYLLAELTRAGFDALQIRRMPPVERLSKAEVRQLAAHVLGPGREELVDPLTRATRDCPLVTVVGGRLLAMRAVHPELLERDNDFRQEVLNRFRDEALGRASEQVRPDLGRRLLELTAALAPVPADVAQFHARMATFLKVDAVEVTRALGEFERAGLLVRRGRSFRVVPDVLADHIMAAACLTPQGAATGFADSVFAEFAGDCLAQLLRNLAELDWRVRLSSGDDSPLLDRVWGRIYEGFRSGGHRARADILRQLRDSAYYLPGRVLELVRYAVRNPAPGVSEEVIPGYVSYTHRDVLRAAPDLLQGCVYAPDCLPACLDLLWELDRGDDENEEKSYFDGDRSPFRVLADLAAYDPDKPLWVYRNVVDAARRWLTRPDAWGGRHTPLDALDPLLEKSGMQHEAEGHGLRLRSFHLKYESVRELRDAVLDILDGSLRAHDLRIILRGVRSLGASLNGPLPYLGMALTTEELRQWEPDQLRVLEMLGRLVEGNPPPVVSLAVLREVRHQARHGHAAAVRERATALVRSIDCSFDFRLTRMLLPEMSRWDLFEEEAGPDPIAGHDERRRALAVSVAAEFWERFPDPGEAVTETDRRIRELMPLEPKCNAAHLSWWLLEARPEAVAAFTRHLLSLPESPIAHCLGVGLVHLHRRDAAAAVELCRVALDTGAAVFRHAVAHHFAWSLGRETPLQEGELGVVRRLLADADAGVRSTAVRALRRVAAYRAREAIDLARDVDVGADSRIVIELCRLADPHWEGCREAFTDDDVNAFLGRIEGLGDLGHEVADFLKFGCERSPQAVVEMLLRRVERQEQEGYRSGYRPVPFNALHDTFAGLAGTARHRELLCRVRDYALGKVGLPLDSLADLYRDVSLRYGAAGTEVLSEWLLNGTPGQMETAAGLLEQAPKNFIFHQLDLVSRALERAEAFGEECLGAVEGCFYRIATSGTRSGTPGRPYPQAIVLRDRCLEVLSGLPVGRAAYRLFRGILQRAEWNIQAAVRDEEE
jgi:hypothetical protein